MPTFHAIIMQGVLSGAFQKDEAGPAIAAKAALLAAFDDLDLLLQASTAFIHVYGCDPYSFATRLSRMAEDLGENSRGNSRHWQPVRSK